MPPMMPPAMSGFMGMPAPGMNTGMPMGYMMQPDAGMMGMGYPGMQMQQPMGGMDPTGAMMGMGYPGMMGGQPFLGQQQMQNIAEPYMQSVPAGPTRIQIQQQDMQADGKVVTKEVVMDCFLTDTSPESIKLFNQATQMITQGQNQEGMNLITQMYNQ